MTRRARFPRPYRSAGPAPWSRRRLLGHGLAGLGWLAAGAPVFLPGCGRDRTSAAPGDGSGGAADSLDVAAPKPPAGATVHELRRVAEVGEVEVAPGRSYRTWLYDGVFPGPEIRVREGDWLRITVENRLPEGTTIHWHGVPVANPMDGVPYVTQEPIPPDGEFVYEFQAEPAGTYMYHSHQGLQLDRGLLGPLVVEEATPHVAYDRDYSLMLDDWLPGEPVSLFDDDRGRMGHRGDDDGGGRGGRSRMGGGMMGEQGGMMEERGGMMGERGGMMGGMGVVTPDYPALLVNGRTAADPPRFEVRRGERVRLRFLNPSSATTFRVAIAGHAMTVTHTDGRPVEPLEVDSLVLSMGERYDVVVDCDNPGNWAIVAAPVLEVEAPAARAVLQYAGVRPAPVDDQVPEGLGNGRLLRLEQLRSLELPLGDGGPVDRQMDLTLGGGMMMGDGGWTIDGQLWPDADRLEVGMGERVRVEMVNHSPMVHPMHLHGHFFRTADVIKDTVLVRAHMDRVAFEFVADNRGDWFFHCHNLYHLEAGMARVVRVA